MSWLESIILGLVEGITEFLPISSTGHLILTRDLLGLEGENVDRQLIIIQGAAILAVCWEFRKKLLHPAFTLLSDATSRRFVLNLLVAFLPLAILGLAFGDYLKAWLFKPVPVAIALVVGGVIILWAERRTHEERIRSVDELTWKDSQTTGRRAPSATPPAGACAATQHPVSGGGYSRRRSPQTRRRSGSCRRSAIYCR